MPDKSRDSIDLPRVPIANDPSFQMTTILDGHIGTYEEDDLMDKRNFRTV
jgi:hypothetical protein